MDDLSETKIRHIEAVQAVITRMASNCFALKAMAGTLTAAVLAYAGGTATPSPMIAVAGLVPVVVFWLLDAQYLRLEKLFRKLHDGILSGDITQPFDMNFSVYIKQVPDVITVAFTWSVLWFYLTLAFVLCVLFRSI